MADNYTGRAGRPNMVWFDDQLDAVTESDGAGGWRLKTSGGGVGGDATAANQTTQIALETAGNATLSSIDTRLATVNGQLNTLASTLRVPVLNVVACVAATPVNVPGFLLGGVTNAAVPVAFTLAQLGTGVRSEEAFYFLSVGKSNQDAYYSILLGNYNAPRNVIPTANGFLIYLSQI